MAVDCLDYLGYDMSFGQADIFTRPMKLTKSPQWILYAGGRSPSDVDSEPELEPWVRDFADTPRITVGDVEDLVAIDIAPKEWLCGVLPSYVQPYCLVVALASTFGQRAMIFMTRTCDKFRRQTRPPPDEIMLGYFQIQLLEPVISVSAIKNNVRHAIEMLRMNEVIRPVGT